MTRAPVVFARAASLSFVVVAAVSTIGCGGGGAKDMPKMGTVTGTVTLDGQPLANATVIFKPEKATGSVGVTDSAGKYELMYGQVKGAVAGSHKVTITTFREGEFEHGEGEDSKKEIKPETPEKVPANYNTQTELLRDVKEGANDIPFDLKST